MKSPKQKAVIELPKQLVDYFCVVQRMIEEGAEEVNTESDDLIQVPEFKVYGGLENIKERRFGFTYFVDDSELMDRWEISISASEIKSIAERTLRSFEGWMCTDEACKNFWTIPDPDCRWCDHPDGRKAAIDAELEFRDMARRFEERSGSELEEIRKSMLEKEKAEKKEIRKGATESEIRDAIRHNWKVTKKYMRKFEKAQNKITKEFLRDKPNN